MADLENGDFDRVIIVGNTASGKSWLSDQMASVLSAPIVRLDDVHWVNGDFTKRQNPDMAIAQIMDASQMDRWIIEGIYGWLMSPIIEHASCVVWIDVPWDTCQQNLLFREQAQRGIVLSEALERWAKEYWSRETSSSYQGHLVLFSAFVGPKFRLTSKRHVTNFVNVVVCTKH